MTAKIVGLSLVLAALTGCGSDVEPDGSGGNGSGGDGVGGDGAGGEGAAGTGASGGSGGALPDGKCRDTSDCDPMTFQECYLPGTNTCGACMVGPSPCNGDQECVDNVGPGNVCGPFDEPCSCGGGTCIPACNGDPDCEDASFACNTGTGHCERRPCDDDVDCGDSAVRCDPSGFCKVAACGDNSDCDENSACSDYFECDPLSCTSDSECGGYCVGGRCAATLGNCEEGAA